MRCVQVLGEEKLAVIDLPEPEPDDNLVVVKILASAICGSEIASYRGPRRLETNIGHEAAGVVWKADRARTVKEGDRVALYALSSCGVCEHCRAGYWILCQNPAPKRYPGCHSQFVLLDERLCLPLPKDISFEVGTLFGDGLGTPFHAIKRLGMSALDVVLIVGLGPVGFAAAIISTFYHAQVIACDNDDNRLERAREFGVPYLFNPANDNVLEKIHGLTDGRGVDKALDCTGDPQGELLCLNAAKRRGKVAFIGENHAGVSINPSDHLIRKDLEVIGSWYYNASDYENLVRLVHRGMPVEKLISHHFALENADRAFSAFCRREGLKMILHPWPESIGE